MIRLSLSYYWGVGNTDGGWSYPKGGRSPVLEGWSSGKTTSPPTPCQPLLPQMPAQKKTVYFL